MNEKEEREWYGKLLRGIAEDLETGRDLEGICQSLEDVLTDLNEDLNKEK